MALDVNDYIRFFAAGGQIGNANLSGIAAGKVTVNDPGAYFAGSDVNAVLQEIGESMSLFARGTIPFAGVRTLNATPVQVIAAPPAGTFIDIRCVHWWLDFGTAAYDNNGAGEDLVLKYTDAAGPQACGVVDEAGFADAVAPAHRMARAAFTSPVAGAPIVAHILVGEWYAAAGDSPLKYEIEYVVKTLAFAA